MTASFSDACDAPSTTILHRPFGGIAGYRQVTDLAGRASIHAFPVERLPQLTAAGLLATAGAYILTDFATAYIGETIRPARRLAEHLLDPQKRPFAQEAFVVTACDGCCFDAAMTVDLQYRLTNLIIQAAKVTVMKGANPPEPRLAQADRTTHDRIFADVRRLLRDAGCDILNPTDCPAVALVPQAASDESADNDAGQMEIGVATTPAGAEEFELTYGDVWARGYFADGHFIVAAGSEIRAQTNISCDHLTRRRRDELFKAGVLARIPGVEHRRRLTTAVAFPSGPIAAKVTCGSHTAARWLALRSPRVVVLEAMRQQQSALIPPGA
jgi:hypothetical protein